MVWWRRAACFILKKKKKRKVQLAGGESPRRSGQAPVLGPSLGFFSRCPAEARAAEGSRLGGGSSARARAQLNHNERRPNWRALCATVALCAKGARASRGESPLLLALRPAHGAGFRRRGRACFAQHVPRWAHASLRVLFARPPIDCRPRAHTHNGQGARPVGRPDHQRARSERVRGTRSVSRLELATRANWPQL